MKTKTKNIGLRLTSPEKVCKDKNCPFHGNLRIRGRMFDAKLIKKDVTRSATVTFPYFYYLSKYERYEKRITKLRAHNPECINAQVNDKVRIVETRPISKTKHFVILEVIKK